MKRLLFFALILCASPALAKLQSEVPGLDGRRCLAYLRMPEGEGPLPLVFTQAGSGIYSPENDEELNPAAGYFLGEGKVAVLTIDKPGIRRESDGTVVVDDPTYNAHTQRDLVECARNAVSWALGQFRIQGDFYLIGHSEGAQIVTRLYSDWLSKDVSASDRVKMIMLSGIPMLGWEEIINYQRAILPIASAFGSSIAIVMMQD